MKEPSCSGVTGPSCFRDQPRIFKREDVLGQARKRDKENLFNSSKKLKQTTAVCLNVNDVFTLLIGFIWFHFFDILCYSHKNAVLRGTCA